MTEQNNIAAAEAPADSGSSSSGALQIVKIAVIIAILGTVVYFGRQVGDYFLVFARWVEDQGPLGPVFFVLAYAVAAVAMVPGSALTLLGGAIFGLAGGTVYVLVGATLGASLAFLIGRHLARGWVESKIAGSPKFAAVDRAVAREGLKIVSLLRLTPIFPFSLGNYMLGLTKVRFLHYVVASLAMLPGTFLYVYYGKIAGSLAEAAAGGGSSERTTGDWVLMGVGLLATIAVTVVVTKTARKALEEETNIDEGAAPGALEKEAAHG